jgi:channel protein (hemolysin III family)
VATVALLGCAEPVSSWLHLGGALLAAWSTGDLCRRGASRGDRVALALFGVGATLALTASGVYHLLEASTTARAVLQRIDHAMIWVLIAGTFTPVHMILFDGAMRWGVIGFIWIAAIAGIVVKTIYFAGFPESLGLALYLGFAWLGAISAIGLGRRYGRAAVLPLISGGVAYTLGGIVSVVGVPPIIPGYVGHHELFHLAVLGALVLHWRLMLGLGRLAIAHRERLAVAIAA